MTIEDLLERGYFPSELPPPFETASFAQNIDTINTEWTRELSRMDRPRKLCFSESKWVQFSIPKVKLARRIISIPNPIHQSKLSKLIIDRWSEINSIYAESALSSSNPVPDTQNKRAFKTQFSFGEFKRKRLLNSFSNLYEVKTDISRFYGTIYTHSIPWLIHTKSVAKANRTDQSLLGNSLDKDLRSSNSGQTVGIPIGPDTSLIISEIITSKMDKYIQENLKKVNAFRFIDDYYIYCDSYASAEKALKTIQSLLTEFQLDINEEKTKISKLPFIFDEKWSIELGTFKFRNRIRSQLTDIERFVNLSFIHSDENPRDSVLLFSIKVLKHITLFNENWKQYETLLLKIGINEPRTLPDVVEVLASNKNRISKRKIKIIIEKLIDVHLPKGHSFEVMWALWMCIEFRINLNKRIAQRIFDSTDKLSILIALDLKEKGLIASTVHTDELLNDLTADSLMNEHWLFAYVSITKGWLNPTQNPIAQNEYFKILSDNGVSFYNSGASNNTFSFRTAEVEDNQSVVSNPIFYSSGGCGGGSY